VLWAQDQYGARCRPPSVDSSEAVREYVGSTFSWPWIDACLASTEAGLVVVCKRFSSNSSL